MPREAASRPRSAAQRAYSGRPPGLEPQNTKTLFTIRERSRLAA
jgi:hypothetical protein